MHRSSAEQVLVSQLEELVVLYDALSDSLFHLHRIRSLLVLRLRPILSRRSDNGYRIPFHPVALLVPEVRVDHGLL